MLLTVLQATCESYTRHSGDVTSNNLKASDLSEFVNKIREHDINGRLPFMFHLAGGNEEILVEIFKEIKDSDYVLSHHRNVFHALLKGVPESKIEHYILNGKSMFIYDKRCNFFTSAIIGGTPAIAAGLAYSLKLNSRQEHVWCFVTDGIEDSGHFAEAVRYCYSKDLPCTFIIEDNNTAVEASKEERWGSPYSLPWPDNVRRYFYEKPEDVPHCRSSCKPDINLLKRNRKPDSFYFKPPQRPSHDIVLTQDPTDMTEKTYSQCITEQNTSLGSEGYLFVGYCLKHGKAAGTISGVPEGQIVETPIAENLMVGLAQGLAMTNNKVVLYFERHDFMLCGMDALVNHLSKLQHISLGEYNAPVIIRACIDDNSLYYTGPTHRQDFTEVLRMMLDFPVLRPQTPAEVISAYSQAKNASTSTMIVESKSLMYS